MRHDPARTTPVGLSKYAKEFLDCALAADETIGERPGYEIIAPVPVMYLIGHAIELSLKAFLSSKNISLSDLASKRYGHDLVKCYDKACELGLRDLVAFESGEVEGMRVLNKLYCTKQLNYIVTGEKIFPVFGPIQSFAERLLGVVGPEVGFQG
ncbi:hypothetical protein QQF73_11615 [Marinobacter sp. M216]|uniref:HEPN domain-containing protein n=1 Tax=Marinobacter albus TaxID=3030833 RepID=A0ABT7HD10_9GAMM|nr:hypothetical protein [Marinobacter sp. M216]MDK9558269.1 hypothetical protein [Marinobacter sp. M216]